MIKHNIAFTTSHFLKNPPLSKSHFYWGFSNESRLPWWLSGKESDGNAGTAGEKVLFQYQKDPLEEGMATQFSILV